MGRAFSETVSADLEGAPQQYAIQFHSLHAFNASTGVRPAVAPGISTEHENALLAGANRIVYGQFSVVNGTLRASATEEDPVTRHMVKMVTASAPLDGGPIAVADILARQLGEARPYETYNAAAVHEYVAGMEAADPGEALAHLRQATAADPDFGRAYVTWLQTALAHNNRAEAQEVLEQVRPHLSRLAPLDGARLQLGAAAMVGDFQARLKALGDLTRLNPADPENHRALGEALVNIRDYDASLVEFRRALSIRPDDILALNAMGYAAAFAGDLPTAIRVLRGYEQLRPNEPNPLDSLGDVHFVLGHYQEAEQFYQAARTKAPQFLNGGEWFKAAQARLMAGDIPGASGIFNRYLAERQAAHDPFADFRAAEWAWITGARRDAIARLDRLRVARAEVQGAVWSLVLGDRQGAAERVRTAMAEAKSGPEAAGAAVVAFLTQPDKLPPPSQEPLADYAQAYAALFASNFQGAAPLLAKIYSRPTNDVDDGTAVLLAWAYEQTGQWQKAAPLLRLNTLPQAAGIPMFAALYFPRIFFLRGELLEHEGNRNDASRNYRLFVALSGPDADMWGEAQRARKY